MLRLLSILFPASDDTLCPAAPPEPESGMCALLYRSTCDEVDLEEPREERTRA